jgi:endonuclease/exonuclease/phosphatase family metal-dependent hydrolase
MRIFASLLILFLSPVASAFSIFSMNLHCGLGDWKSRVDIVVAEIVKEAPDVIGLQEVCYNRDMNMGAYIHQQLTKAGYPVKAMETQDTHRSFLKYQEQLLLMSRHEATETKKGNLPSVPLLRNGYVTMKIGSRWFLTTHLHFALPMVRERQFAAIQEAFGN